MKVFLMIGIFLLMVKKGYSQELFSQRMDSLCRKIVGKNQLPSIAVTMVKNDQIIYSYAYGLKQTNRQDSVTEKSMYYWASVSKVFTACAIMKLQEEEKLDLDDYVKQYIPNFETKKGEYLSDSITIRHLLSHTSGLPKFGRKWLVTNSKNQKALSLHSKHLQKVKLKNLAGETYLYSNWGMNILAMIVEKISNMNFDEFVQQSFFNKLALNQSTFQEVNNLKDTSLANLHVWSKKKKQYIFQEKQVFLNASKGAGGLKMSINNMALWMMACLQQDPRILQQTSFNEMWTQYKSFQALGWDTGNYWGLGKHIAKGGNLEWMSNSYILLFPSQKIGIAIVVNADSNEFDGKEGFAAKIIEELLKNY